MAAFYWLGYLYLWIGDEGFTKQWIDMDVKGPECCGISRCLTFLHSPLVHALSHWLRIFFFFLSVFF